MKFLWSISVAILFWSSSLFAQSALQFDLNYTDLDLSAKATFAQHPQVAVEAFMDLEIVNATTKAPYQAQSVEVELFMPDMDHGSKQTTIIEPSTGVYRVSDMYFLMGGLWEVRVKITSPDGMTEQQIFELEFDPASGACTSRP